jgi:hypothetical protein
MNKRGCNKTPAAVKADEKNWGHPGLFQLSTFGFVECKELDGSVLPQETFSRSRALFTEFSQNAAKLVNIAPKGYSTKSYATTICQKIWITGQIHPSSNALHSTIKGAHDASHWQYLRRRSLSSEYDDHWPRGYPSALHILSHGSSEGTWHVLLLPGLMLLSEDTAMYSPSLSGITSLPLAAAMPALTLTAIGTAAKSG